MSDDMFIDADNFQSGDKGFGVKVILFQHLGRTLANGSKEWHGGYWKSRILFLPNGQSQEIQEYVPNSREEWQHSVETLSDYLSPYEDDSFKKDREYFEKDLKDLKDKYKGEEEKDEAKLTFYNNKRADLYRKLFAALNRLLKRKNYLEMGALEN